MTCLDYDNFNIFLQNLTDKVYIQKFYDKNYNPILKPFLCLLDLFWAQFDCYRLKVI